MRIKTCEVYCKDKVTDTRDIVKSLESKAEKYGTKTQIDKIFE